METFQHQLQKFDPGIVWLDCNNQVSSLNDVARRVLGPAAEKAFGQHILQFHPEKSRDKVAWLLDSARCPVDPPPPVTMMINIPDRVLLIKVSKMIGADQVSPVGTCMIFYDLTELTTTAHSPNAEHGRPRQLFKLPVYINNRILLVDLDEVVHLKAEGHYTTVYTSQTNYLCNLSLSDLEERMAESHYLRVHRSHMINLQYTRGFEKQDDQSFVLMDCVEQPRVPVSRSNVKGLKEALGLV